MAFYDEGKKRICHRDINLATTTLARRRKCESNTRKLKHSTWAFKNVIYCSRLRQASKNCCLFPCRTDSYDFAVYRQGSRRSQLLVRNATFSSGGNYACHAQRDSDGWSEIASAHVDVIAPPVITSLPKTVTVTHG